jgi:hypothetical protein
VGADVQKVKAIKEISKYGVFATPGLVINNTVKSSGRLPSSDEIKGWINEELPQN